MSAPFHPYLCRPFYGRHGDFYERTGLRTVDLISGGFPCQPFSLAGKRKGRDDDRYLWPEMLRVIEELRPHWVVGENVANIVNMALDTVLSDLEKIDYTCQAFIIPACAVDAPHRRNRCAIVAHADGERREKFQFSAVTNGAAAVGGTDHAGNVSDPDGANEQKPFKLENASGRAQPTDSSIDVPHPDYGGRIMRRERELSAVESAGSGGKDYGGRAPEHGTGEWWPTEPGLGGMADGFPHWLDEPVDVPRIVTGIKDRVNRLKCLGNAVVPQQFYPIFQAIAEIERNYKANEQNEN